MTVPKARSMTTQMSEFVWKIFTQQPPPHTTRLGWIGVKSSAITCLQKNGQINNNKHTAKHCGLKLLTVRFRMWILANRQMVSQAISSSQPNPMVVCSFVYFYWMCVFLLCFLPSVKHWWRSWRTPSYPRSARKQMVWRSSSAAVSVVNVHNTFCGGRCLKSWWQRKTDHACSFCSFVRRFIFPTVLVSDQGESENRTNKELWRFAPSTDVLDQRHRSDQPLMGPFFFF